VKRDAASGGPPTSSAYDSAVFVTMVAVAMSIRHRLEKPRARSAWITRSVIFHSRCSVPSGPVNAAAGDRC